MEGRRHPPNSDDLAISGCQIIGEILIVPIPVRIGHQHLDVAPHDLAFGVAEHFFRGRAEGKDKPCFIDHHHGVRNGGKDRAQMRFFLNSRDEARLVHERVHSNAEGTKAVSLSEHT